MSRIRLITFDVMNTILKTRVSIGEEYASVARRFGLNLDAGRINQEFPKVFKGLWDTQPNFGASRGISARDWWTTAVQATCDHSGLNLENPETFETVSSVAQALFEVGSRSINQLIKRLID
jgi:FMN phosphatase YigB (HAD superfamily)